VRTFLSAALALFLVSAPIAHAFAAAPVPSRRRVLVAPRGASSVPVSSRLPHARRPKPSFVAAAPSSEPRPDAVPSRRRAVPVWERAAPPPPFSARPDHPPA